MKNFHTGLEKYCLVLFVMISSFAIGQINTWIGGSGTGAKKNDWNTSANWSLTKVPTETTDVVIPKVTYMPIIAANTSAVANNLTINTGATLTTADDSTSLLNIKGNFTNNGTLKAGAASLVTFDGNIASLIEGSAKSSFGNLAINKTASSVTSRDKAFAVNGNLTVTQGDLILTATDTDYTVAKDLTVAAAGTLTHNVAWNSPTRKRSCF